MGRTVLPYSWLWEEERERWQKFRRALRKEDQTHFDRLFESARLYLQAGVYAANPWTLESMLMAMLLEHEKALKRLEEQVHDLKLREPEGASVEVDELDDSPARVVVTFDGDVNLLGPRDRLFRETVEFFTGTMLPFATLMYVWDGQAPVEKAVAYARTGRVQYLVVESGPARAGGWLANRRNVVEDYRRVFGGERGASATSACWPTATT